MISAKIIADSVNPQGIRLVTLQLRYPKFIHGEFMTHRLFSRNASSSRAIPVSRLVADIQEDPVEPVYWGKNKKGMQAELALEALEQMEALRLWYSARDSVIAHVRALEELGAHKQIVNRLLEPWSYINVVVTATEWANFFALRKHLDAQPEMQTLATKIWEAMDESVPKELLPGEWHLPYVDDQSIEEIGFIEPMQRYDAKIKVSVARCARVSYLTHDQKRPTIREDLALYERLVHANPPHMSPAEHQATPDSEVRSKTRLGVVQTGWRHPDEHGNLCGWRQYRKMLMGEAVADHK